MIARFSHNEQCMKEQDNKIYIIHNPMVYFIIIDSHTFTYNIHIHIVSIHNFMLSLFHTQHSHCLYNLSSVFSRSMCPINRSLQSNVRSKYTLVVLDPVTRLEWITFLTFVKCQLIAGEQTFTGSDVLYARKPLTNPGDMTYEVLEFLLGQHGSFFRVHRFFRIIRLEKSSHINPSVPSFFYDGSVGAVADVDRILSRTRVGSEALLGCC